jgi:hypothetical protein
VSECKIDLGHEPEGAHGPLYDLGFLLLLNGRRRDCACICSLGRNRVGDIHRQVM